jgi:uncharacterized membrane protein YraQ (UPF0718 family)
MAFLISTPESGVDSISISWALLDPIMTVVRPVAAFVSAFVAGVVENFRSLPKVDTYGKPDLSCPIDNCCDGTDCSPEEQTAQIVHLKSIEIIIPWPINCYREYGMPLPSSGEI